MTRKKTDKPVKKIPKFEVKPEFQPKTFNPKTDGQKILLNTIAENVLTLCQGPAGSGKTALAIYYAATHLLTGQCEKIIISRPIVPGGHEEMGFLPGSAEDKIHPYLIPMFDELKKYMSHSDLALHKNNKTIEIVPIAHMRGRTFNNAVIVLDEAANATYEQLMMFITRIGFNSKMIIVGDTEQSDLNTGYQGALETFFDRLKDEKDIGTVQLSKEDIVRHEIIGRILKKMKKD